MLVEELNQLGEVGERAGQPVDLIDDDHANSSRSNGVQQLRQGGPFHRPAGEAAVVVALPHQPPAFVGLALDIGF